MTRYAPRMVTGSGRVVVGIVAAWQVQEAVKLLTGLGRILRHQLLFMDAETAIVESLKVGEGAS